MIKLNEKIKPRKWQTEALELWKEEFKGIVSVVTGGGKTIFAEMCIQEFFKLFPKGTVVIVVPTISLLDQWYISIQEDLDLKIEDIACFSGQEKSKKTSLINLIVINSARKIQDYKFDENDVFIIFDECHRAGSAINSLSLKINHKASLGISATPERQYDEGFEKYISPALGRVIFSYNYEQAYRDNVISPFELLNVRINLLPWEQRKFDILSRKIAIESQKINEKLGSEDRLKILLQQRSTISNSAIMRIPVAAKIAEQQRGDRILIFHERIDAANKLYEILEQRNYSVTIYHSKISPLIRRDNLRLYRRGVFDSIISCKALDEGLNVPDTNIAIIASSTASFRQRIQRMGRVLRPSPGKDIAKIYTIYATDIEKKRLLAEANNMKEITSVYWFNAGGESHG